MHDKQKRPTILEELTREDKPKSNFYLELLGIKRVLYNPNPKQDLFSQEDRLDCVIRSVCKVLNENWKNVYTDLSIIALETCFLPSDYRAFSIYLSKFGYINIADELDDIESIGQFMYTYKNGRYLISNGPHIVAYIDGTWYDNCACLKEDPTNFIFSEPCNIFVNINDENFSNEIKHTLDYLHRHNLNSEIVNNFTLKI